MDENPTTIRFTDRSPSTEREPKASLSGDEGAHPFEEILSVERLVAATRPDRPERYRRKHRWGVSS